MHSSAVPSLPRTGTRSHREPETESVLDSQVVAGCWSARLSRRHGACDSITCVYLHVCVPCHREGTAAAFPCIFVLPNCNRWRAGARPGSRTHEATRGCPCRGLSSPRSPPRIGTTRCLNTSLFPPRRISALMTNVSDPEHVHKRPTESNEKVFIFRHVLLGQRRPRIEEMKLIPSTRAFPPACAEVTDFSGTRRF